MRVVFADTAFYVGLVNPHDELHAAAVDSARSFKGTVVTTEYVLVELGTGSPARGTKKYS